MTANTVAKPWDFSHVLGLVNSLSASVATTEESKHRNGLAPKHVTVNGGRGVQDETGVQEQDFAAFAPSLGDFSKVYRYLGTPPVSPSPIATGLPAVSRAPLLLSKDDYASDGATYVKTKREKGKTVQWIDQTSADELATDTFSDGSVGTDPTTLTKNQRKKRNRKERRAKEAAERTRANIVSESEADIITRKAPARKASSHVVVAAAPKKHDVKEEDSCISDVQEAPKTQGLDSLLESARLARERLGAAKQADKQASALQQSNVVPVPPTTVTDPKKENKNSTFQEPPVTPAQNGTRYESPPSRPMAQSSTQTSAMRFVPATVRPLPYTPERSISTPHHATSNAHHSGLKSANTIEPLIVRSGEDRHWALLMKLLGDFWVDRAHLISPMNLTTHNNDPHGIHVFVDASNIFIGFNDQLKRSRGIPSHVQVPAVDLSFDALALLMERRRPVAKRVLVGSTPHLAAFDKAKAVGYECNILEKVYKARELTERQIYFQERDRLAQYGGSAGSNRKDRAKAPSSSSSHHHHQHAPDMNLLGTSAGSGSETSTPQFAPARMIEQGVDEILHLKILESVVDADDPGTIVLATGDAAQAEYSQGFMAMAQRALKKGWTVELVSWSKNISTMYTRREWTQAWGERFRIVYLDDYAEELLDM